MAKPVGKCKNCGATSPLSGWTSKRQSLCKDCLEPCLTCKGRGTTYTFLTGRYRCPVCHGKCTAIKRIES